MEQECAPVRDNTASSPAPVQNMKGIRLELDDSHVTPAYANFCRVASTPEEVILDLALNPDPSNGPVQRVKLSQRVVLNHFTAKRLAALLSATVHRHEQVFGALETDVRKRVQPEIAAAMR